jgi:hypothetical protein
LGVVLAAGAFRADGTKVLGHWPIEKAFLQTVLAGK